MALECDVDNMTEREREGEEGGRRGWKKRSVVYSPGTDGNIDEIREGHDV